MFLVPAPVKITEEALQKYEAKLDSAADYNRKLHAPAVQACLTYLACCMQLRIDTAQPDLLKKRLPAVSGTS